MNAMLGDLSKDQLVLAMLAVMGGIERDVNERDLFLACWHAFPSAMRWADTALPNPDTFTASLRRLDADGLIQRTGKQLRGRRKTSKSSPALRVGRSGVVKARITAGGLDRAGIGEQQLDEVRRQWPRPSDYRAAEPAILIARCVAARMEQGRETDEGALVELAFHKFPAAFSYLARPEFPDLELIRAAIRRSQELNLVDAGYQLTSQGRARLAADETPLQVRADASSSVQVGALRHAQRIEASRAYQTFLASGSVVATKADELFRTLQLPPTTDSRKIAAALQTRIRDLRRVDRGEAVAFLLRLAERYHPEVLDQLSDE